MSTTSATTTTTAATAAMNMSPLDVSIAAYCYIVRMCVCGVCVCLCVCVFVSLSVSRCINVNYVWDNDNDCDDYSDEHLAACCKQCLDGTDAAWPVCLSVTLVGRIGGDFVLQKGGSQEHIWLITIMFCFNQFAFTVNVKHKINSIQILCFILICLYFTTGHFHTSVLCEECSLFPI